MSIEKRGVVQKGRIFETNRCGDLEVLEVFPKTARVRFLSTGYERLAGKGEIVRGVVNDVFYPKYYGVGYIGQGCYSPKDNRMNHMRWQDILRRCFDPDFKHNSYYKNCTVEEAWHNFQNYMGWAVLQKGFDNKGWHIDKDLLSRTGQPHYGPETCVFLPRVLNMALIPPKVGSDGFPSSIRYNEKCNNYYIICPQINKKSRHVGSCSTLEEAFEIYKNHKELYVHKLAEKYRKDISIKAFEALMDWKFEGY